MLKKIICVGINGTNYIITLFITVADAWKTVCTMTD